jgi:hypothetical protein
MDKLFYLFILSLFFFASCASQKRCYRKWPYVQGDTVWLHDTMQIEIPGTSAQADIEAKKVFGLNAGDSLVVTSNDGKSRAILRRLLPTRLDSVGGFQLRSVVDGRKFTKTIKLPCPPQKYLIPPPKIIYKVPLWVWIAFGGLGTALGYQTFRRLF